MMSLKSIVICLNCLVVKIEQQGGLNEEILQDLKKYFSLAMERLELDNKLSARKISSLRKKLFDFSKTDIIILNINRLSKI